MPVIKTQLRHVCIITQWKNNRLTANSGCQHPIVVPPPRHVPSNLGSNQFPYPIGLIPGTEVARQTNPVLFCCFPDSVVAETDR